ncbi:MAG: hypothetical protein HYR56_30655 [Acidobacteria bacterium]|nr:hypothetical protein [Acidobacteriota bacterium]MBI3423545.1 hypothetical protein [Acidobacteriota bacterium]
MSTVTAEKILQQIEQLPPGEQARFDQLLAARRAGQPPASPKPPRDKRLPAQPLKDRTRELQWLAAHQHEYAGQWVALAGDRLIAASPNRLEISAAIKAAGVELPLIHRIAAPDEPLPMGL